MRQWESGMKIKFMALPRLKIKEASLIGDNGRMAARKDTEHMSLQMETSIWDNQLRVSGTAME